jgi:hypothetical protein
MFSSLPSRPSNQILYTFLISPKHVTHFAHLIIHDLIILIIFDRVQIMALLINPQSPVTSSLSVQIFS